LREAAPGFIWAAVPAAIAARRPKQCHLAAPPPPARHVASQLLLNWSPQHIAVRLKTARLDTQIMPVSLEPIYQTPFCQARSAGGD